MKAAGCERCATKSNHWSAIGFKVECGKTIDAEALSKAASRVYGGDGGGLVNQCTGGSPLRGQPGTILSRGELSGRPGTW